MSEDENPNSSKDYEEHRRITLKVLSLIGRYNVHKMPIWFTRASNIEGYNRLMISIGMDYLMDRELMYIKYTIVDDKNTACFFLTDEGMRLYKYLHGG